MKNKIIKAVRRMCKNAVAPVKKIDKRIRVVSRGIHKFQSWHEIHYSANSM